MEPDHAVVVFEPINHEYGWGRYGEFQVLIRKEDGYINATKLCTDGGKLFSNWSRLDVAKRFTYEFGQFLNIDPDKLVCCNMKGCNELRGSYAHPLIIPHIAMWISSRFAVKVSLFLQKWRRLSIGNDNEYWSSMLDCVENHPSSNDQEEKKWQVMIAAREAGRMEVAVPDGRIDVLTELKLIEVKKARGWKHALGQVLVYAYSFKDHEKWLALYDCGSVDQDHVREVCGEFGVRVEFLD